MRRNDSDDEATDTLSPGGVEPKLEFYAQVGAWQHGPLYDDLARLPKGRRRAERLRTLAYLGVLVEQERVSGEAKPGSPRSAPSPASASAGGIFDAPLLE